MDDHLDLGTALTALANDLRRGIVTELASLPAGAEQERACGSFDLPVTKATKTHHFRVLREAGLITQRDHGNGSAITLRRTEIERDLPGLLELLSAAPRQAR
jgi:DNA-binding transcriptional ArsR family regulator